jgi:phage FluMu protein Com
LDNDQLIERFNERAGICEHCGGLSKADAEWIAYLEVKKLVGRTKEGNAVPLPDEIVKVVKVAKNQKFLF